MISKDMPATEYHAIKALSASMAFAMVEQCPLKAWTASPFNPNAVVEHEPHFDIGTAAHLAVLEPHLFAERVVVIGPESLDKNGNYGTKEARQIRDDAYAMGLTPLKPAEADLVDRLQRAVLADPDASALFRNGDPEVSLTWEWDGVPCKARPDFIMSVSNSLIDLKTAESAEPRSVSRKAFNEGWHVRAAWYLRGTRELIGTRPPQHYWFVVVEKDPPHIVQVYEMDARALAWGEMIIGRALALFAECQRTGVWPRYRDKPSIIELPEWAEFQLADREGRGEFSRTKTADAIRRGNEFLAP